MTVRKTDNARVNSRAGIKRGQRALAHLRRSKILDILGPDCFAEFTAVRTPATVLWCNFELARELGFEVPQANRMTPQFHEQLVAALSYRVLPPGEDLKDRQTILLYADRYGGTGLGPALGAGRAGFLPDGNLYLKGVGLTPLFRHDDPDDFPHSHGGVQLNDCLAEAVFGEVNQHLLTQGSTRILAILDQHQVVVYPNGYTVPIALVVRSGTQLRPGHLLSRQVRRTCSLLEIFQRMTKATGQLVTRRSGPSPVKTPDIKSTMRRIVDDHARTSAELFRWRMIHGAVTSSNLEMSGAMLDLTSQTAQPRTAPVCFLHEDLSTFGYEHIERATEIDKAYRALVRSIPVEQRCLLNARTFNLIAEMREAYRQHLQIQILCATGLKREMAAHVQTEHRDLAHRFTLTLTKMCKLSNPGSVEMGRAVVENVSVLDVFNLLRTFPVTHFANPEARHAREIRAALKPIFTGNKGHVKKMRAAVRELIKEFGDVYRELMNACQVRAKDHYADVARMVASITSRAAFENEPLNLYRTKLYGEFDDAIQAYQSNGRSESIWTAIEHRLSASLRKVDALLTQGTSRRLSGGGFELEMRSIAGVNYSLKAWNNRRQTRRLQVSLPIQRSGNNYITTLPGWPRLTRKQIESLRYRFTTDGWQSSEVCGVRLRKDGEGNYLLVCDDIEALPQVGRLDGFFSSRRDSRKSLTAAGMKRGCYAFAVPDKHELIELARSL